MHVLCMFLSIISIFILLVESLNVNKVNAANSRNNLLISILYCLRIISLMSARISLLFSLQVDKVLVLFTLLFLFTNSLCEKYRFQIVL